MSSKNEEEGKERVFYKTTIDRLRNFIDDWNALPIETKRVCMSESMRDLNFAKGVGFHDPLSGNWKCFSHGK